MKKNNKIYNKKNNNVKNRTPIYDKILKFNDYKMSSVTDIKFVT